MIQLFKQTTGNLGLSKGVPLKGRPGLSLQQTSHGRKWKKTGQEPVAGHALFTKATVSELEKEKTQLQNALKEWKAKVYKPNPKVITTGDKDAFRFTKRSITQLNEKRRNDAIRNIQSQITDIDEAIVRVGKKEQEEKSEATYQKVVKERKQTEAEKAAGIESKMKEFNPLDVLLGKALLLKAQPIKGRPGLALQQTGKGRRWKRTGEKSKSEGIYFTLKGSKFHAFESSIGWNLHEDESPVKMNIKSYNSLKELQADVKKIAELNKKYSSAKYKAGSRVIAKVGKGTESAWVKRVTGKDSYWVGLVDTGGEMHLRDADLFPRFSTGVEWKKAMPIKGRPGIYLDMAAHRYKQTQKKPDSRIAKLKPDELKKYNVYRKDDLKMAEKYLDRIAPVRSKVGEEYAKVSDKVTSIWQSVSIGDYNVSTTEGMGKYQQARKKKFDKEFPDVNLDRQLSAINRDRKDKFKAIWNKVEYLAEHIVKTRLKKKGEKVPHSFKWGGEPIYKAMPSEAQAEAGNYKMQHYRRDGMDISIENPKGSYRQGVTREGKKWRTQLKHHYGYIRGTKGIDKDHVDVFVKPGSKEGLPVHVVNQCDPKSGKFDEHKCMMGFDSEAEAKKAYHANYQKGWKGLMNLVKLPMDEFKTWVKSSEPRKGELRVIKKSMLLILDIFKGTPLKNKPGLALVVTNKGKRWKRIGEKPKAVRPGAKPQVAQPVEKKPAAPVKRAPRRTHDWLKRKGGEYDEKAMASSLKKAGFKNSKDIAEAVSFYTQASVVGMGMKESSTGSYIIKRVELGKKIPDGAMRYLEQVNKVDKNRLIQIAENLENFIDTAPAYDGLIYNGSKKSAMDRGWSKGDTIQFDTVRSFSSDRGVTNDFGQWKIITNAPDKSVGIANISYYDEEQEVLVGKGAKFTVDDIDVDLKEIYLSPTNGLEKAMKDAAEPKKEPKANKKYSRYTIDNDDVTVIKKGDKDAAI